MTEATEVIAVIRIGVSLVEHIYKVFSHIFKDSGLSEADLLGKQRDPYSCISKIEPPKQNYR